MALHLNLLHEEISELRQRRRDPLKLGTIALGAIGALMLLFYMFKAYQTLAIKTRLSAVQSEWSAIEPEVTAAQKRTQELTTIVSATAALDSLIDERFYWGPLLEKLARCVAPNVQLNSVTGMTNEKIVELTIEGIAAGREPRAAAEDLRQLLNEQLSQSYGDVKVKFKALEDLDTLINVSGASMPVARYTLSVTLNRLTPAATETNSSAPARVKQ